MLLIVDQPKVFHFLRQLTDYPFNSLIFRLLLCIILLYRCILNALMGIQPISDSS